MNIENVTKILRAQLKWIVICVLLGMTTGSASAFFLIALDWVTQYRENNNWLIWLLSIGGLLIGCSYYYGGETVVKGNNLLLEELSKLADQMQAKKWIQPAELLKLRLFISGQ